jgi:hypothetical protein
MLTENTYMIPRAVRKSGSLIFYLTIVLTTLGMTLPLTSSHAFTIDKELYDLSICRGQLEANTLYNLQVGLETEDAVAENIQLYVAVWATRFWELIVAKELSREDAPQYDGFHSQAYGLMINSLDQETFGSDEYEQLLGCNTLFMKQMLKKRELFDNDGFKTMATAVQDQVVGNYWIMMGLDYWKK